MSTEVMPQMTSSMYSRVLSYPMVSTAVDQVASIYNMSKEKSGLVRCTFEVAEKSVALAAATAKPVVDRCEKPIAMVNGYACKQLDKLEEKVPIITEPTDKVVSKVKNETWKVIDNGKKSSSNYVNSLIDTRVGNLVTSGVDTALMVTEHAVDYYLPSDDENMAIDQDSDEASRDVAAPLQHCTIKEENPGSIKRVTTLSSKVHRRLYQRAIKRVRYIQKKSQETIDKLHFTVNLIDYAKKNIDSANENIRANVRNTHETLWKTWNDWTTDEETESIQGEETLENEENQAVAAEMRTLAIARVLSKRLQVLSGNLASAVSAMPQNIRMKVAEGRDMAESLYHTLEEVQYFRDLPSNVLSLARQRLNSLQDLSMEVGDYILNCRPFQWLVPQQVRTCKEETEISMDDDIRGLPAETEKESDEKEIVEADDDEGEDEVDEIDDESEGDETSDTEI
ncbi:perilipin-2-like isoform X4 [Anneissia japonica]|nr:perilipin-2-like isoform X4 [Anneissia japonica]XP_033108804.1 perilipin-2-like isoform X4 [Anneissia japonica]XP_033108805.1 perilipin-2-like isoform X4 [Anneissia japonica]